MALSLISAVSAYVANSLASVSVTVGDLIIVCYSFQESTVPTCSDNAGGGSNTYNAATDAIRISGTEVRGYIFYAIAKATETLTITLTAKSDNGLSVHVVRGNDTTLGSVLDQVNTYTAGSSSTAHSSGSITTTVADEYIICFWYQQSGNATLTENGTGFTKRTEVTNHVHQTFDRIVSSTGTYQDTITSSTSQPYNALIASFKMASGGATGTSRLINGCLVGGNLTGSLA